MVDQRIKMPTGLKAFIYCYIGAYPIVTHFTYENNTPIIFQVLILAFGSFFFSYGVMSFVLDIKKGGISNVIRKIKEFLYS